MADFQLDIPQQRQQFADFLRLLVGQLFAAEDQQVDVGKRMQLAATVAADGDQRSVLNLAKTVVQPQALEHLVDKFGARLDELFRADAFVERNAEPALEGFQPAFDIGAVQAVFGPVYRVVRLAGQSGEGVQASSGMELLIAPPIRKNDYQKKAGICRLFIIRCARLSPGWCHPSVTSVFRSRCLSPQ